MEKMATKGDGILCSRRYPFATRNLYAMIVPAPTVMKNRGGIRVEFKRPKYHFTPASGWINDPNGLIYAFGKYHLFAQHNPEDTVWGPMHWLHGVSDDLLHWQEIGIALYPDELGTMFSGSAVMDALGRMTLMYTAHGAKEQQCVAFSRDGAHFEKSAGNPVIPNPGIPDFRDPKVFWNRIYGCWSAAIAAGDEVQFYRSADLLHWERTGAFSTAESRAGNIFECPDCFSLAAPDGKIYDVLTVSMIFRQRELGCRMRYFIGEFQGDTFVQTVFPQEALALEQGYDCYAGVTYAGMKESVWMAWMTATSCPLPLRGYCGSLTLARKLSLRDTPRGLRLCQTCILPARTLEPVACGTALPENYVLEIMAEKPFHLQLQDEKGSCLDLGLDSQNRIYTWRRKSERFAADSPYNERQSSYWPRSETGALSLQVVVDAWCVEIFGDYGQYAHGLLVFWEGNIQRIDWQGQADVRCAVL